MELSQPRVFLGTVSPNATLCVRFAWNEDQKTLPEQDVGVFFCLKASTTLQDALACLSLVCSIPLDHHVWESVKSVGIACGSRRLGASEFELPLSSLVEGAEVLRPSMFDTFSRRSEPFNDDIIPRINLKLESNISVGIRSRACFYSTNLLSSWILTALPGTESSIDLLKNITRKLLFESNVSFSDPMEQVESFFSNHPGREILNLLGFQQSEDMFVLSQSNFDLDVCLSVYQFLQSLSQFRRFEQTSRSVLAVGFSAKPPIFSFGNNSSSFVQSSGSSTGLGSIGGGSSFRSEIPLGSDRQIFQRVNRNHYSSSSTYAADRHESTLTFFPRSGGSKFYFAPASTPPSFTFGRASSVAYGSVEGNRVPEHSRSSANLSNVGLLNSHQSSINPRWTPVMPTFLNPGTLIDSTQNAHSRSTSSASNRTVPQGHVQPAPASSFPASNVSPSYHTLSPHSGLIRQGVSSNDRSLRNRATSELNDLTLAIALQSQLEEIKIANEEERASLELARRLQYEELMNAVERGYASRGVASILSAGNRNPPARKGVTPEKLKSFKVFKIDRVSLTDPQKHFGSAHCTICLEDWKLKDTLTSLNCKHCFHQSCIEKWLSDHVRCPLDNLTV